MNDTPAYAYCHVAKKKKVFSSAARAFDRFKGTPVYNIEIYKYTWIYDFVGEALILKYIKEHYSIKSEFIKKIYVSDINSMIDEEYH